MTDAGTGGDAAAERDAAGEAADAAGGGAPERDAAGGAATGRDDAYRGLPGAFVYALRASGSWLFRSYVVVAALLTVAVSLLVGLGVLALVAGVGGGSGVFNLSRAFYALVGLAVLAPVLAPVLLVARRHRRGSGNSDGSGRADGSGTGSRYDRRMALGGYLVVASLYVGLVTTVPSAQQEPVSGLLAPAVEVLYALPPAAGFVPPLAAAAVVALLHRAGG